jgi:hypothetical protein
MLNRVRLRRQKRFHFDAGEIFNRSKRRERRRDECESGMEGGFGNKETKIRKKVPEGGSLSNEERLSLHGVVMQKPAKTCKNLQTGRGEISKGRFYTRRRVGVHGSSFRLCLVVSHVMSCRCVNRDGPRLTAMKRD